LPNVPVRPPILCSRPARAPLTRKALARRIAKHATRAAERCPSLSAKTITPHVLRHTAAMRLLHAGVDTTVIALWLGHEQVETTQMYLHADLALKERELDVVGTRVVLSGPLRRLRVARSATCRRRPGRDTASERQDVSGVEAVDVPAR